MQMFGLTIEGHGHNILTQSEQAKQDQTGLDSLEYCYHCHVSVSHVCLTCLSLRMWPSSSRTARLTWSRTR